MLPVVLMTKYACKGTGTSFSGVSKEHNPNGRQSSRPSSIRRHCG
jgi:hypothetical protein